MATLRLRSTDGSDASDGASWADAKATLAGALAAAAAGDTIWVSKSHSEATGANITLTSAGTADSWVRILCVDDTGDPEPPTALATTAVVTPDANAAITFNGFAYAYGITFAAGGTGGLANADINFTSTAPWGWVLESCKLVINSSNAGALIVVGTTGTSGDDALLVLNNTTVKFGNTAQYINRCIARCIWKNTPSAIDATGSLPAVLFFPYTSGGSAQILLDGVDLSALGSGQAIFNASQPFMHDLEMRNCKLGASVAITTGTIPGPGASIVKMYNCDSADTNYRLYEQRYSGTVRQETTIKRTGGASQKHNGSDVGYSICMTTTASAHLLWPLVSLPIAYPNETTGSSVTVTVEIVNDGTTLTDAEAWVEVSYYGTSGFPIASFASDRVATVLASAASQTSSSETWTTTGLTSPVKQKLAVTFTPQEQGVFIATVHLARASQTIYLCPKLTIS